MHWRRNLLIWRESWLFSEWKRKQFPETWGSFLLWITLIAHCSRYFHYTLWYHHMNDSSAPFVCTDFTWYYKQSSHPILKNSSFNKCIFVVFHTSVLDVHVFLMIKQMLLCVTSRQCVIVLECAQATKVSLLVSYVTSCASWTPSYDIRMFTADNLLKVRKYKGTISLTCKNYVKNVKKKTR